jgi:hypothetical protein
MSAARPCSGAPHVRATECARPPRFHIRQQVTNRILATLAPGSLAARTVRTATLRQRTWIARPPELEKSGARENRDRGETRRSRASRIPPTAGFKAFSLLPCTGKSGEVRLFLRKSRAEIGCPVYTRSENAITAKPGRRGESPPGADSCAGMRLKTETTSRTGLGEGLSQARNEFRHHDSLDPRASRSMPLLRTGAILVALLR